MRDIEAFFTEADKDGSGELSYTELANMLRSKGYKENDGTLQKMFDTADNTGDDKISLQEFMVVMGQATPEEHGKAMMRSLCRDFDKDGSGEIDAAELKAVFEEQGKHFTDDQLERMIAQCDSDGSGTMNYEEFLKQIFG